MTEPMRILRAHRPGPEEAVEEAAPQEEGVAVVEEAAGHLKMVRLQLRLAEGEVQQKQVIPKILVNRNLLHQQKEVLLLR